VIKPGAQQGQHPRRAGVDTVVYKLVTAALRSRCGWTLSRPMSSLPSFTQL